LRKEEDKEEVEAGNSRKEKTYLDHFTHTATGFFEDSLHAFAGCLCLVGDTAFDEVSVLVGGDLARDEDVVAYLDCLALLMVLVEILWNCLV
jgi:hypothetical protein